MPASRALWKASRADSSFEGAPAAINTINLAASARPCWSHAAAALTPVSIYAWDPAFVRHHVVDARSASLEDESGSVGLATSAKSTTPMFTCVAADEHVLKQRQM
jgi:hypothetical protein